MQLVEFGDFECPFCGRAYPIVESLRRNFGEQLLFAFRHFPILHSHPHAEAAAEAVEAAGAQGKFWEMYDLVYTHQSALELADLEEYARRLGIDAEEVAHDVRRRRFAEKIRADLHSGAISGVNGAPTFFVNGERHDGPWDYDSLVEALTTAGGVELRV
jgi:protein-disulfide isomerase